MHTYAESGISDHFHALFHCELCQLIAGPEGIDINPLYRAGDGNGRQLCAVAKGALFNDRNALRDGHIGQIPAALERAFSKLFEPLRHDNLRQLSAILKRASADSSDMLRDDNRCNGIIILESAGADLLDLIRDHHFPAGARIAGEHTACINVKCIRPLLHRFFRGIYKIAGNRTACNQDDQDNCHDHQRFMFFIESTGFFLDFCGHRRKLCAAEDAGCNSIIIGFSTFWTNHF